MVCIMFSYYSDDFIDTETAKDGVRKYKGKNVEWASVTTIIGKFQDKTALRIWQKKVGKEEANEVMQSSSSRGTHVHKANELLFSVQEPEKYTSYISELNEEEVRRHRLFYPFIRVCHPYAIEKRFMWQGNYTPPEEDLTTRIGFGGTCDIVAGINTDSLKDLFPKLNLACKKPRISFVGDYKNWSKPKYTKDLFPYFLQLSAYQKAVNQYLPQEEKIEDAFLLITVNDSDKLTLVHINSEELNWFWYWFQNLCYCYYNNFSFDWNVFVEATNEKGFRGNRQSSAVISTGL